MSVPTHRSGERQRADKKPAMPAAVSSVWAELCGRCPTPCAAHQAGQIDHADPCTVCPLMPPRFGPYGHCEDHARPTFGLGDAVAAVAQPIARAIDRVTGTNLAGCGGCTGPGGRKEALNALVPDIRRPLS